MIQPSERISIDSCDHRWVYRAIFIWICGEKLSNCRLGMEWIYGKIGNSFSFNSFALFQFPIFMVDFCGSLLSLPLSLLVLLAVRACLLFMQLLSLGFEWDVYAFLSSSRRERNINTQTHSSCSKKKLFIFKWPTIVYAWFKCCIFVSFLFCLSSTAVRTTEPKSIVKKNP